MYVLLGRHRGISCRSHSQSDWCGKLSYYKSDADFFVNADCCAIEELSKPPLLSHSINKTDNFSGISLPKSTDTRSELLLYSYTEFASTSPMEFKNSSKLLKAPQSKNTLRYSIFTHTTVSGVWVEIIALSTFTTTTSGKYLR